MTRIEDGAAWVSFAYDIGQHIDLELAEQRSAGCARDPILHQRRAPSYLQFQPAPLRLFESASELTIGALQTDGRVESTLYDFGAVSIAYRLPIAGRALDELPAVATVLAEHTQLLDDSRRRAGRLLETLGDAVRSPNLADLVEDYTVFHARRWSPEQDPRSIVDGNRALIARILRAETETQRDDEVQDALQFRIGYGLRDDLVIDWHGAFLFDPHGEDTLTVLEFANVELLEMRFLDDRLDAALDRSHATLRSRGARPSWLRQLLRRDGHLAMRRIANLQIDNALLFEAVNNAVKLVGDQFLARTYRLAARRFHLDDWDASILRKLQTLESIYGKLQDEQSTTRMEVLEWIIIVLFVVSIVLPFLVGGH